MKNLYRTFYKDFYLKTGGFVPFSPLVNNVYPGDFFQIRNHQLIPLGNIYLNNLISPENCVISEPILLNEPDWNIDAGVSNSLSNEVDFIKNTIRFKEAGNFIFKAKSPETIKVTNWKSIQDELIIKLTQTQFSFRELFIVTESVTTASWALAMASDTEAELTLAKEGEKTDGENNLFGNKASKIIQSKNIEYHHANNKRTPNFFKAKKLVVQDDVVNTFVNDLIIQREGVHDWANDFYDYNFEPPVNKETNRTVMHAKESVLDLLSAGELNPSTALQYFKWVDAGLDDVERLFEK